MVRIMLPLLLALAAPAAAQETEPAFAGIPNVTIDYYDVSGSTVPEIRASMAARGLRDSADGSAIDAQSHVEMRWRWEGDGKGGCDLANASVEFSATVILPRLIDVETVPAPVLLRWRSFATALSEHEAGHIRYGFNRVADVKAAIAASDCTGANDAARAVIEANNLRDATYDQVTRHGQAQGAVFAE